MRRHRRLLIILAVLLLLFGASTWAAGPHVWAWHHFKAARTDLERYHSAEARDHLKVCLRIWPNDAEIYLLASRAARQDGAFEEAKEHLHECQRLEQTPSAQSVQEGILLRAAMGDLDEVEEYLHTRADKDPAQAPLFWEALAEGYLRMYRIFDAHRCLDKWRERQPDNAQAAFLRGKVYRQVNALPKASPEYGRAVELDPQRDDARWWLAVCLTETGRYDEAVPHLEYLRPRRPGDPEVLVRLARCQSKIGRRNQARELLDAVLAEHPDYGLALRTQGEIARLKGDLPQAENWLRKAVRVMPHDYLANWYLQEALRLQDKTAEAKVQSARTEQLKRLWERLGEIESHEMSARPHDPALHCEMGIKLLSLGHQELGERWLLSALHQDPHFQPAHAALADYYQAQRDLGKAADHRRQLTSKK